MNYGEFTNLISTLNTGANNPAQLALLTKLVLGKIARKRLQSRIKIATITTGGATEFQLGSSSILPDFLEMKLDAANHNRSVYYLDTNSNAIYLSTKPYSFVKASPSALLWGIQGRKLYITDDSIVTSILFPYYSKYLVLDQDGTTEKETPANDDDEFLLPSEFDDVIVDGVMVYISRREKKDSEHRKNVKDWEASLSDLMFTQ